MNFIVKILSIGANIVDPDQTAPKEQSDQGRHCLQYEYHQIIRFSQLIGLIFMSKTCWAEFIALTTAADNIH